MFHTWTTNCYKCMRGMYRNWTLWSKKLCLRSNSLMYFGQKSEEFSSLLFTVTSTTGFTPPPPPTHTHIKQKWVETCLYRKHCIRKPRVWKLSRLCPETSTKLYVHEYGFCGQPCLLFLKTISRDLKNQIDRRVEGRLGSWLCPLSWTVHHNFASEG